MKIELRKKTEFNGDVWYYIAKDGQDMSGSWSMTYEKTEAFYNNIVEQGLPQPTEEVLKTTEI